MALKARVLVALATLLALGLAGVRLGHEPFWFDEFLTWRGAQLPFAEIWPQSSRQYHPPLYFWFMHGWLRVVPAPDEFWLRLPSAFFFGLTVPMVYLVGRALGGTSRAGVYAAFLAATAPFLLHYGQNARPYAMLTFFAACGFAAAARIMCRCRDEARPRIIGAGLVDAARLFARGHWRGSGLYGGRSYDPHAPVLCGGRSYDPHAPGWRVLGDDGVWLAYIVSSVVVMLLHNTAGVFPAVTGLILLCAIGTAPSHRGVRFANLCIAMGIIALLYSPQIPHLLSGVGRISLFYVPAPDADRVLRVFQRVYGGAAGSQGRLPLLLLTILVMTAAVAWAWNRRWERTAFALLGWLLAPALLIAFSFWKPILQPRLLTWTLVPFLAAGGAGLALVPWRPVCAALLAALLAFHLQGVAREWKSVAQDWPGVSRLIARDASPDAAVLICPRWYRQIFEYYRKREGGGDLRLHLIHVFSGRERIFEAGTANGRGPEVDPAKLFAHYPQVWLVWTGGCDGRLDFLTTTLGQQGRLVRESREEGVRIRWYERSE